MNLKPLTTFCLVADLGSLSRAAASAGLAQSLVSRHIAQLEAQWGDRLFVRTGRGMALSAFGRQMQPGIKRVLEQLSHLETVAVKQLAWCLARCTWACCRRWRTSCCRCCSPTCASGRHWCGCTSLKASAARGEDVLGTVDTFLVGKPGHPLLGGKKVLFKQLAELPLVLPAPPNGLRSTLDQLSRRHSVQLDVVMEVDTSTAMKDVASSGHAFTLLPAMAVSEELRSGSLAAVPIVNPGIKRTIALSLTTQRPLSNAARLVATRVRQLAMKLLLA